MLPNNPSFSTAAIPQQVYAYLRQLILEGKVFKPGEKINIDRLSHDWEVSKTPIREALKNLEQTRLVQYVPRKGFFIASLDWKDLLDLADLRVALEMHALYRGYHRIDRKEAKRLRDEFIKNMNTDADILFGDMITVTPSNKLIEG